jgi:hypothetical protein
VSTRCSIKWRDQSEDAPGFHLWDDAFERLTEGEKSPVYLRLEGVQVHELETTNGGAILTVQLPRDMALSMGLLPNTTAETRQTALKGKA